MLPEDAILKNAYECIDPVEHEFKQVFHLLKNLGFEDGEAMDPLLLSELTNLNTSLRKTLCNILKKSAYQEPAYHSQDEEPLTQLFSDNVTPLSHSRYLIGELRTDFLNQRSDLRLDCESPFDEIAFLVEEISHALKAIKTNAEAYMQNALLEKALAKAASKGSPFLGQYKLEQPPQQSSA